MREIRAAVTRYRSGYSWRWYECPACGLMLGKRGAHHACSHAREIEALQDALTYYRRLLFGPGAS